MNKAHAKLRERYQPYSWRIMKLSRFHSQK